MSAQPPYRVRKEQRGSPPAQTAFAVSIALLILLLWLHFILAQDIESIGRQLQARRQELDRIERQNHALMGDISLRQAEDNMAGQAWDMGYRPQSPLYLAVNRPLVQSTSQGGELGLLFPWPPPPATGDLEAEGQPGESRLAASRP